jgi:carbon-monoxide dehydrogenase large subunit
MSVMGTRVERVEDPTFLTSGGAYLADLRDPRLDGAAAVVFVRSTAAHARITSIDTTDAAGGPGVVGVFTAADVDLGPLGPGLPGLLPDAMGRSWLASDTVRYVGEPIAVVVAESPAEALDAAEQVWVDYDPLPAVVGPLAAATDEVLLFPDHGTNTAMEIPFGHTGDELFAGCDVVVRQEITNQRLAACPLEPRGVATTWHEGRLVFWSSTQAPHGVKGALATRYDLEPGQVHVIAPAVGGGFGAKIAAQADELLLPWVARRVGRPVRWIESRSENMVAMPHGRGQANLVEIGGSRDGDVEAYRLTVLQDAGAYPSMGAALTFLTRAMAQGTYEIARVECNIKAVATNSTVVEAYRGAGRPEASAAIERAMDLFAAEIGLDPAEVRRRNLVPAEAFPYTTQTGSTYDCGDYAGALDRALDAAGYADLRAEQAERRARGDAVQLGIGVSTYVEVTAGPSPGETEFAKVVIGTDGGATVYTGSSAHGQGHRTSWSMIASDLTGIPMADIEVVAGDTDLVAEGTGTFGSRSLQVGGAAVHDATRALVERARQVAADLLEAAVGDVVLDTGSGRFHVAGTPSVWRGWAEVAAAAALADPLGAGATGATGVAEGLVETTTFTTTSPTYPFGAHVAVVEVDTETGEVRLRSIVTCDDAGRLVNPLIVEGQRHGGIAQGVAQALMEEIRYDDDGNPVTSNFADYAVISAAELPSFTLVAMETPTDVNPLGAKGIGESGTIGSTPAVQSAVIDALAPLGVRHLDMPATPERVWRAIGEAAARDRLVR